MANLIDLIKELRDRTGAGLMDCKKALLANGEDVSKAADWLREKGIAKQAKKAATRTAAEGVSWVMVNGNTAAIIEVNSETDFVANSDPFRALVKEVNEVVLANKPADVAAAKACLTKEGKTLNDLFVDAGIKLGEKLDFRRVAVVEKTDDEVFGPYIHMNGKIATLVVFECLLHESDLQSHGRYPECCHRKGKRHRTRSCKAGCQVCFQAGSHPEEDCRRKGQESPRRICFE